MKKILCIVILLSFWFFGCDSSESTSPSGNGGGDIPEQGETYWWNETVFYEIFVRSFYDSNGDGIGDIQGLIQKLDYLNDGDPETDDDLGVTGLWLMPVSQSPSYHGYDVVDYKTIDSDYGTNEDFLQLIDEAHSRGIKVIVDYVMNHSSNQHPWFINSADINSEYRNWYRWSPVNPGHTQPWGDYPAWHESNGFYYYGVFWGGMPDLNYEEPAVRDTMFDIAQFWLEEMNVDGFRCDAVKYIIEDGVELENTSQTYAFWADFNDFYKSVKPNAMAVGEAWDASSVVGEYVGDKFDFCFEFDLATAIINGVNLRSPDYITSQLEMMQDIYPYHQFGAFLTNHDQNRVMNELGNDVKKAKLAASVYLTLPGVPFIYYGEEIGMTGQGAHENIRTPMQWNNQSNSGFTTGNPWRSVNSDYTTKNVEAYQNYVGSIWSYYRDLIKIRTTHTGLTKGIYQEILSDNSSILSYLRYDVDDIVIAAFNFSTTPYDDVGLSIEASSISAGTYSVVELLSGQSAGELTINENGGFSNWKPLQTFDGRTSYLFNLLPE